MQTKMSLGTVRRFNPSPSLAAAAEAHKAVERVLGVGVSYSYARKLTGLIQREATIAVDVAPAPYCADFGSIIEHANYLAISLPGLQQAQTNGLPPKWGLAAEMLQRIYRQAEANLDAPEPYRASFEALAVRADALVELLDTLASREATNNLKRAALSAPFASLEDGPGG